MILAFADIAVQGSVRRGTAIVDFGAFPGAAEASVVVTGLTWVDAATRILAWVHPAATADHDVDDHIGEPIRVVATDIVPGTGFTLRAFYDPPQTGVDPLRNRGFVPANNHSLLLWGDYTLAWAAV